MSLVCSVVNNGAGLIAPVADFADAEAKACWERSYPDVLRQYYQAIAAMAIGTGACGSGCGAGGVGTVRTAGAAVSAAVEQFGLVGAGTDDISACGSLHVYGGVSSVGSSNRRTNGGGRAAVVDEVGGSLVDAVVVTGGASESRNDGFSGGCGDGIRVSGEVGGNSKKYIPPAKRGPKGGLSVGRGPNYDKNQAARQRKKEARGLRGAGQAVRMPTFDACDQSVRDELQRTRANRLVVENKLRTVKMEQELEVVRSRDVQQMIQQQRTQLLRQTELNKVQIEKAHGSLSGEVAGSVPVVPTVVGGTVETVLTGGSISPSSSISEAEIRKLHKDFLDSQARIAKLEKDNYKLRFGVHQEDSEGGPDDGAPWDGGEDSMSQDQFSYRSGYMCTPEQREENKKLALELRGW